LHLYVDQGKTEPVYLPDIKPSGELEVKVQMTPEKRGALRVVSFQCETAYPFGMFRGVIDIAMEQELVVYPELLPTLPGLLRSEHVARGYAPHNSGDYQYLSGYRPGDDVRLIHWRKSTLSENPVLKRDLIQSEVVEPRVFVPDPCDHFEYAVSAMATYFHGHDSTGWSIYTSEGIQPVDGPEDMLRYLAFVQPLASRPAAEDGDNVFYLYASQLNP
jgi:hypothetical protein